MSFIALLGDWQRPGTGLARSLAAAIRAAILDGRLPVGSPLPSERSLGDRLGVSRGTVVAAFTLLRQEGWVRTRGGSGSAACLPDQITERTTPWSLDQGGAGPVLDMQWAVTAAPHERYLAALAAAVERFRPRLCDDGLPDAGLPGLRAALAERYTREGLPTAAEQILVTTGATAAVTLLAAQFDDRRRPYVVESLTYPGVLAMLRRHRARLVVVPVTDDGWQRPADIIAAAKPALAVLTPDFHNPTGALMPPAERRRVAAVADRFDVPVVVDETMRELDLRTPQRPPARLHGRRVFTVSSLSKVVWGGLRVGWIRARPDEVRALLLNPLQSRLSPPPLEQLVAEELLADLDAILTDRLRRLRTQRDHLVGLLAGRDDWTYAVPDGGLSVWLRLRHTGGDTLAAAAQGRGLMLAPGSAFSADGTAPPYIRLPYTATSDVLTRAVSLLAP